MISWCNNKKKVLSIVIGLLLRPTTAFASGDPIFLYGLVLVATMHVAMGGFLTFSKMFANRKLLFVALFFCNVAFSWMWALNYRGPNFASMYIVLIGGPLFTFLCLIWLVKKRAK